MAALTNRRPGDRVGRLAWIVATVGGIGLVPLAGGTVASVAALLAGAGLMRFPPWSLAIAAVLATAGGLWAVRALGAEDDPGWVVIDEVAGQWIAMLALHNDRPIGLLAAFALFRLLDIAKPGPVAWADRQKSAAGVMGDDLVAGGLAAAVLWAIQAAWPNLLG
jgi:phosphatidylglycerophosphatase A